MRKNSRAGRRQLGLVIDTARGIIEQKNIRRIGQRATHKNFLLRSTAQAGDSALELPAHGQNVTPSLDE
jgi:hypothetical protein